MHGVRLVLVGALGKPFGPLFRLLSMVQGLPLVEGVITDITGWELEYDVVSMSSINPLGPSHI